MRKYVIINRDEVENIDFSQVLETNENTLRYKLDGSQTFVKFEGDTPSFLEGKTTYTLDNMRSILNNPDNGWIE
tara:strand:+ start:198 stop:419 length:222 start_codon:yes stop_codon:yes gene_type:complete